jgi:putative membrane protein
MMWGYGYGPGWMGGWGGGFEWIGMIVWIVILVLVLAAVVWFVRAMTHPGHAQSAGERRSRGLEVLEERYARGEIRREEYLEKKKDITG